LKKYSQGTEGKALSYSTRENEEGAEGAWVEVPGEAGEGDYGLLVHSGSTEHIYIAWCFPGMLIRCVALIISRVVNLSLSLESNICFAWDPGCSCFLTAGGKGLGDEALGKNMKNGVDLQGLCEIQQVSNWVNKL